jgi:hypothetical protein
MVEINAPVLRERMHLSNKPENRRPIAFLLALILGRIPATKGSTGRLPSFEDVARAAVS